MAGIGFALRDLVRKDDLLGVVRGYGHSAIIACAPWLFTVLTLASLTALGPRFTTYDKSILFRLLIIYNFAFSLILTAPMIHMATRVIADSIYRKNVRPTVTHLLVLLGAAYGSGLIVAAPFYFLAADLSDSVALAATINFAVVSGIWVVSIFLSALKDYRTISLSFLFGMAIAFFCSLALAPRFGTAGMIWGFTLGLGLLQSSLIARILAEFPFELVDPRPVIREYGRHVLIGLGGLAYALGIWVDKWIMWSSPERNVLGGSLVFYPDYDGAMFLAFMTTLPAFAVFTMMTETDFFESYHGFHQNIRMHATLKRIKEDERAVFRTMMTAFRNITILQGTVTVLAILLAPQIVSVFGVTSMQISMFRIATLGAFFHVMFMFSTIILAYFDQQRSNLFLYMVFFAGNALFTVASLRLGFRFYGYGYFLAAVLAFAVAAPIVLRALQRLRHLSFVKRDSLF